MTGEIFSTVSSLGRLLQVPWAIAIYSHGHQTVASTTGVHRKTRIRMRQRRGIEPMDIVALMLPGIRQSSPATAGVHGTVPRIGRKSLMDPVERMLCIRVQPPSIITPTTTGKGTSVYGYSGRM